MFHHSGAAAMPMKTILVYLPSVKVTENIMAAVANLAAPSQAHIIGLHISPSMPLYAEFAAELPPDVYEKLVEAGRKNAEAVKSAFEERARTCHLSHEWRYLDLSYGTGEEQVAAETHSADLIICAKPSDDNPDPWSEFPETAVLQSGRPVLLLPPRFEPQFGKHVVIAWNNTRESARAVFDSLGMLRSAVTVRAVTLIENEDERASAEAAGARLIAALSRHGIPTKFDVSFAGDDSTGEYLVSRLTDEECDLLIMGGYSRSPLREMIFGGVSRVVLRETWVPTLVSH
jgi:nucleotide-binding universal stress UspA family protein